MKLDKSSHLYGLIRYAMRLGFLMMVMILGGVGTLMAKDNESPDFIRSTGKIYVVAGVCLIILVTLLAYMVILDRKITRLEKRQKNE